MKNYFFIMSNWLYLVLCAVKPYFQVGKENIIILHFHPNSPIITRRIPVIYELKLLVVIRNKP